MNLHAARSATTSALVFGAEEAKQSPSGGDGFAALLDERRAERAADGARMGQRNAFDVAPPPRRPEPAAPAPARAREVCADRSRLNDPERDRVPQRERPADEASQSVESRSAARRNERARDGGAARERRAEAKTEDSTEVADAADAADTAAPAASNRLDDDRPASVFEWLAHLEPARAAPTEVGDSLLASPGAEVDGTYAMTPLGEGGASAADARADAVAGSDPSLMHAVDGSAAAALSDELLNLSDAASDAPRGMGASESTPLAPAGVTASALASGVSAHGATAAPAAAGSGVTVQVATPLGAPDFSQALATQLTTLARNGVQEATLQLNPAEMGPIAVKIVLDGAQAQIDFAAEQARTRAALEAGLPTLAAALHGAGLTLTGGGVFERRHHPDEAQWTPQEAESGGIEATGAPSAAVPRRTLVRGLLDAYA